MKNKNQKGLALNLSKGFTLVELLVVIAIIGILATLLLLQLGVARQRSRDAKRITDISQVRTAVELYFDDHGYYPQTGAFTSLESLLVPKYLTHLPIDPIHGGGYDYRYAYSGLTKFHLSAELEQYAAALKSDADINSTGWVGEGANATVEICTPAETDCMYDLGQDQ